MKRNKNFKSASIFRYILKNFPLFLLFSILAGCTRLPSSLIKDETDAIRNLEEQWIADTKNRDVDKFMSVYAPRIALMPQDAPVIIGTQSAREQIEPMLADTTMQWETFSGTMDTIEVSQSGDMGYVRWSQRVNVNAPGGPVEAAFKGVDILKKIDGKWKVVVNIWNSDKPLAEPPSSASLTDEFTRLEQEWSTAIQNKDSMALNQLYAKEYIYTNENGMTFNRQQDINDIISGSYKSLAPSVISDVSVNLFGNVAVVNGLNSIKATYKGKDISGKYRFSDVFVMRDGRWQCVSTHASKVV